jgi:murein L,D-transpeptidase YcbB/YkuD
MRDLHAVIAAVAVLLLAGSGSAGAVDRTWLDAANRPTRDAYEALTLLHDAAVEGLDPADYQSSLLDSLAAALAQAPAADAAVRFDGMLTSNMVRYLHDLHSGRVDPRAAGFRMAAPPDHHDFAAVLRDAVARHRLRQAAEELTPPFAMYRALREALARYRGLAGDATLTHLPLPERTLRPGEQATGIPALRRFLVAVGDLPSNSAESAASAIYDPPLVAAIERFQARHGIDSDGVIGPQTKSALRVPLAARTRQLELALERLRWLPHLGDDRLVAINIPMFRLWAWDGRPANLPSLDMEVIVGRALSTQTPVFVETMESVIFRPYWNVPASIVRHEILPRIARNPAYLEGQNMELLAGPEDGARVVPPTPENIERLKRGALRVRQRPGPNNALGLVKFVFPNNENIYMHATPAAQLFSQSRRDFSHGCVRVADPIRLAEWVLENRPEWTRDRIVAAMEGRGTVRVDLERPIQVILFYVTAAVMPDDGTLRFAEDIYKHDAKLERALEGRAGK